MMVLRRAAFTMLMSRDRYFAVQGFGVLLFIDSMSCHPLNKKKAPSDGEALLCPAVKPGLAGLGLSRDVAATFQAETWGPGGETWHSFDISRTLRCWFRTCCYGFTELALCRALLQVRHDSNTKVFRTLSAEPV